MEGASWVALGLALINTFQALALAFIAQRQRHIVSQMDGHLSKLTDTQATNSELAARQGDER